MSNTKHITSNYFSFRSKQHRIPYKTMINLYEVFTRLHFDYGDVALITAKNKFIYKSKQIQMNVLRFELNVSRSINNNIVKNVLMYLQLMKQ